LSLDIPDQVRKTVMADGNESWLDELPGVVDSLAQEWALMIGSSFGGGHAALVVEVTLANGTPAVLKIGVPGRDVGQEAMVLRLANGRGCARLLCEDVGRQALLLERLGAAMYDIVADPVSRHNLLCDVAVRLWRPIDPGIDLPTGATLAEQYADRLPGLWEQAGRPCSPATVADALDCMNRRRLTGAVRILFFPLSYSIAGTGHLPGVTSPVWYAMTTACARSRRPSKAGPS
jgi:streptomycin 6-kinase